MWVPEQDPQAPHTLVVLIGRVRSPVPACQPLLQALGQAGERVKGHQCEPSDQLQQQQRPADQEAETHTNTAAKRRANCADHPTGEIGAPGYDAACDGAADLSSTCCSPGNLANRLLPRLDGASGGTGRSGRSMSTLCYAARGMASIHGRLTSCSASTIRHAGRRSASRPSGLPRRCPPILGGARSCLASAIYSDLSPSRRCARDLAGPRGIGAPHGRRARSPPPAGGAIGGLVCLTRLGHSRPLRKVPSQGVPRARAALLAASHLSERFAPYGVPY